MNKIEQYLGDGANWQAQAVLAYLRMAAFRVRECTKPLIADPEIEVGRYENCREQGYVFRLKVGTEILMNYAVYEHRNNLADVIPDCSPRLRESLRNWDDALRRAAAEMQFIAKGNIRPLTINDPDYPQRLRECPDAPII